jgi:hypothetical protein
MSLHTLICTSITILLTPPPHFSTLLHTPPHSSSLLLTPPHSSSLLLTPPHSSSAKIRVERYLLYYLYPQRASLKSMPATVGIEPNLFLSSVPMCRNTYLHKHYKYFCKYSFHELMQNLKLTQTVKF